MYLREIGGSSGSPEERVRNLEGMGEKGGSRGWKWRLRLRNGEEGRR